MTLTSANAWAWDLGTQAMMERAKNSRPSGEPKISPACVIKYQYMTTLVKNKGEKAVDRINSSAYLS